MLEKQRRIKEALSKKINENVIVKNFLVQDALTKKQFIKAFKGALDEALKKGVDKFELYYVGHGHEHDGAWVMGRDPNDSNHLIQFKEILNIIN